MQEKARRRLIEKRNKGKAVRTFYLWGIDCRAILKTAISLSLFAV
jgi:hypothetical protein